MSLPAAGDCRPSVPECKSACSIDACRLQSDIAELRDLYERVMPRLDAIIRHLDTFPTNDIPTAERALEYLAYAAVEASLAVERFGQPAVPDSFDALRFVPLHE